MFRRGLALCLLLALLCSQTRGSGSQPTGRFGHARWRYYSPRGLSTVFRPDNIVQLEYLSESEPIEGTIGGQTAADILWQVAPTRVTDVLGSCTVYGNSSSTATLSCDDAVLTARVDLQRMSGNSLAVENSTDSFHIAFTSGADCYDWYTALLPVGSRNDTIADYSGQGTRNLDALPPNFVGELRVWAVDPSTYSVGEARGSAVLPSALSASVTQDFFYSGQTPIVTLHAYAALSFYIAAGPVEVTSRSRSTTTGLTSDVFFAPVDISTVDANIRPRWSDDGYWSVLVQSLPEAPLRDASIQDDAEPGYSTVPRRVSSAGIAEVSVRSNGVAVMGCAVAPLRTQLAVEGIPSTSELTSDRTLRDPPDFLATQLNQTVAAAYVTNTTHKARANPGILGAGDPYLIPFPSAKLPLRASACARNVAVMVLGNASTSAVPGWDADNHTANTPANGLRYLVYTRSLLTGRPRSAYGGGLVVQDGLNDSVLAQEAASQSGFAGTGEVNVNSVLLQLPQALANGTGGGAGFVTIADGWDTPVNQTALLPPLVDAAVSEDYVVVVSSVGSVFYLNHNSVNASSFLSFFSAVGGSLELFGFRASRLAVPMQCDRLLSATCGGSWYRSVVVAWNPHYMGGMYLSYSNGRRFTALAFPNDTLLAGEGLERLWDLQVVPSTNHMAVLVQRNDSSQLVVAYDFVSQSWEARAEFEDAGALRNSTSVAQPGLYVPANGDSLFYAYGDALYVTMSHGRSFTEVRLYSRDPARPAPGLAPDENILCMTSSLHGGRFAVLTSRNRVFVGSPGLGSGPAALEIQAGIALPAYSSAPVGSGALFPHALRLDGPRGDTLSVLAFDWTGGVGFRENWASSHRYGVGGWLSVRHVPLANELDTDLFPTADTAVPEDAGVSQAVYTRLLRMRDDLLAPCPYLSRYQARFGGSYLDIGGVLTQELGVASKVDRSVAGVAVSASVDQSRAVLSSNLAVVRQNSQTMGAVLDNGLSDLHSSQDMGAVRVGAGVGVDPGVMSTGVVETVRQVHVTEAAVDYLNRTERDMLARGNLVVASVTSQSTLKCPQARLSAMVRVGCPPGRHIRVRTPDGCGFSSAVQRRASDAQPDLSFQGRLSAFQNGLSTTQAGGGSVSNVGPAPMHLSQCTGAAAQSFAEFFRCPHDVFQQTEGFQPVIELWDGDVYVKEMEGDYVMREITGRTDFSFIATARGQQCLSMPLSWRELDPNGKRSVSSYHPDTDSAIWSEKNHLSCFVTNANRPLVGDPSYDIFNASNGNKIVFPYEGDDGIFKFHVRVVDEEYSYCPLETFFSINTFGAAMPRVDVLTIVGTATAVMLLMLLISYFYYRRVQLARQLKEMEKEQELEEQRLQEKAKKL